MKNTVMLSELLNHMEWADSSVWKALLDYPDAIKDGNLKEILIHHHTVQWAFLKTWKEQPADIPIESNSKSFDSILRLVKQYYFELNEYSVTLDLYDLNKVTVVPWIDLVTEKLGKEPGKVTLAETIMQVSIHSAHHRGQINKRFREIGGTPPDVDFIVWGWIGKPDAQWDEVEL